MKFGFINIHYSRIFFPVAALYIAHVFVKSSKLINSLIPLLWINFYFFSFEKFTHCFPVRTYCPKIFDLFKRLDKVNYQGIGMGLALCKKIVNIYGGEIDALSNEAGGATFEFNIPKEQNRKAVFI